MGIDFTHCDARWSYGGFDRARTRLAKEFDIVLQEMVGFGGNVPWDHSRSPVMYLLDHSDCDGNLSPEQCREIAPALRAAVASWPDDDYDKKTFLELADGMEEAADFGEALEFM